MATKKHSRSKVRAEAEKPRKKKIYSKKSKFYFTADTVAKLRPKAKQYLAWDGPDPARKRGPEHANGLCVLVSPGAKSWRCVFYFRGNPKPHYLQIGRIGELLPRGDDESVTAHLNREIEEARRRTRNARALASPGDPNTDPQDPRADVASRKDSFEKVVLDFIKHEQIGRRNNSSALATQKFMLTNCAAWKPRAIATIRFADVERLLWSMRDGDPDKGIKPRLAASVRLFAHLRDLFKWASRPNGPLKVSPIVAMHAPGTIAVRDRVYGDDELLAIWRAADALDTTAGGYVKLMMLLGLRREEMAQARWSEFDSANEPTLFTVPTERVKLKAAAKLRTNPVYRIPLPPLASRILRGLRCDGERVFPGMNPDKLKAALVTRGAPDDFILHVFRHTVATWLQNQGHAQWQLGLVLNHADGNDATAGYSHGDALDLKRQLLTKWADHVEGLVTAEGVRRLR